MPYIHRIAVLIVLSVCGCVEPDPTLPPPIERLYPTDRVRLAVAETENESPLATVAALTAATNTMLVRLLERSEHFVMASPGEAARYRLETAIAAFRDEGGAESLVYGEEVGFSGLRHAVVELRYRVLDHGNVLLEGTLSGTRGALGSAIPVPGRQELVTGAYWNTPFGHATRNCLDQLVRLLADVL